MKFIDKDQIRSEENNQYKPYALETLTQNLPYNSIGDRSFEILTYRLFSKEKPALYDGQEITVELMEGVADRGRDICFINSRGQINGVAQCKNWKEKITRPKLISEILKMILFFIDEGVDYFPDKYWIVCPMGVNSEGKKLIRNFSHEIKSDDIKKIFEKLKEDYVSFATFDFSKIENNINMAFEQLKVIEFTDVDLTQLLRRHLDILSLHFQILPVIDVKSNEKMLDQKFTEYGMKLLTDTDLKILQESIGKIPESARIRMLGLDFYGIYIDDLDFQKKESQQLCKSLLHSQALLKKILMDRIAEDVRTEVLEKITGLLLKGKIHQNSVQYAPLFLIKIILREFLNSSLPKEMLKDELPYEDFFKVVEKEVLKEILETSEKILNKDYSTIVGDAALVKFKIKVFETHLLLGFSNIEEVKSKLIADIDIMRPILKEIADKLIQKYTLPKTIVIHDQRIWNSKDYMEIASKTLSIINKEGTRKDN